MTTPPTGGAHTFLVKLCEPLAHRGWKVSFVTQPGEDSAIPRALAAVGGEIHDDLWRAIHLPEERAARLARWVNQSRPDAYLISTSPDTGWLALPLLDPRIPTVCVAHNDVEAYYAPLRHYAPFIDCAVGVSAETYRKIVDECGMPTERARRIPYGVESLDVVEAEARWTRAARGGEPLRIAYVGRMVEPQKRVMDFARLASELERRRVAFELHFIGDGSERDALAAELKRLGLAERARFWGWLTPEEVRAKSLALDVFVLMSDHEGLPVALLEAMGRALVPVVTDIESGNGEVVEDGRNGFLVAVGDIEAFAERLESLARDRALMSSLARAAWETSRQYTVERMADGYVECFEYVKARSATGASDERRRRESYPVMPSCASRYPLWLRKLKRRAALSMDAGRARAK